MQRQLTKGRGIDLSKDESEGCKMVSAKFIVICGFLMGVISMYVSIPLVVGSVSVSIFNMAGRPSNRTYIISVLLLLTIAMRAAWILQELS